MADRIPAVPRGNRSNVYQLMVDMMTADPDLSKIFPGEGSWNYSSGKPFDVAKVGPKPCVYMTPRPYTAGWYGPDAMSGILQVDIYFWLPGNNVGQYDAFMALDVWEVLERVFYPPDDTPRREKQNAVRQKLKDAGAKTGLVMFSQPATQMQTAEHGLVSYGQLQIDVVRRISP